MHPGGPFWAHKDAGAWSLPKGELEDGEDALLGARRELEEETGQKPPEGPWVELGEIEQKSGKRVVAFAARGAFEVATLRSNQVELEWPKGSGRLLRFPEVDRALWATLGQARALVNPAQLPLVERALAIDFDSTT